MSREKYDDGDDDDVDAVADDDSIFSRELDWMWGANRPHLC